MKKFVAAACGIASLALVWLSFAPSAEAAVIAQFDFDGNNYVADPANPTGANQNLDLTSSAPGIIGVSVSDIQFSPGLDATAALGQWADAYDGALGFSTDVNDDRLLNETDQAVFFRVTLQPGATMSLDALNFDTLKTRGNNATGSRLTYSVFVNPAGDPAVDGLVGNFDPDFQSAHDHFDSGQPGAETTGENFSTGRDSAGPIDLSEFQNLSGTNTFAIRLYGSEDDTDLDFGLDRIILTGSVTAIPEPTSLAFLSSLTVVSITRRRRRKGFRGFASTAQ
jgi:hypothetical protein